MLARSDRAGLHCRREGWRLRCDLGSSAGKVPHNLLSLAGVAGRRFKLLRHEGKIEGGKDETKTFLF